MSTTTTTTASPSGRSWLATPRPIARLFARFPLHVYAANELPVNRQTTAHLAAASTSSSSSSSSSRPEATPSSSSNNTAAEKRQQRRLETNGPRSRTKSSDPSSWSSFSSSPPAPSSAPLPSSHDLPTLYIFTTSPRYPGHPSFNPTCLRAQALLLFRGVRFGVWAASNHAAGGGGGLPFAVRAGREVEGVGGAGVGVGGGGVGKSRVVTAGKIGARAVEEGRRQRQKRRQRLVGDGDRNQRRAADAGDDDDDDDEADEKVGDEAEQRQQSPQIAIPDSSLPTPSPLSDTTADRATVYLSLIDRLIRPAYLHAVYLAPDTLPKRTTDAPPTLLATYLSQATAVHPLQSFIARGLRAAARSELANLGRSPRQQLHTTADGTAVAQEEYEELYADARRGFEALETLLLHGREEDNGSGGGAGVTGWFFGAQRPGTLDAGVFGYVHVVLAASVPSRSAVTGKDSPGMARLQSVLGEFAGLTEHRQRVLGTYFESKPQQ